MAALDPFLPLAQRQLSTHCRHRASNLRPGRRYSSEMLGTRKDTTRSRDMTGDRIVAVGLLTQANWDLLGPTLARVWPVVETPCFSGLLQAIDEADRELRRSGDANDDSSE